MESIITQPREAFIQCILHSSINEDYNKAIREWDLLLTYSRPKDDYTDCICGQPIIHCCLIRNRHTNKVEVIGHTCKTKYINSINNISLSALSELYRNKVINQWEYGFMENVAKYTEHSYKQRNVYKRIVDKIFRYYKSKETTQKHT